MPQSTPVKYKQYYLFENFPNLDLFCAFSTRILGNMSLFYGDTGNALENRKNFLVSLRNRLPKFSMRKTGSWKPDQIYPRD